MRTRTRADGDEGGEEISLLFGSAVCAFISFPRRRGGGVSPPSPLLHTGRPSAQTPSSPCHWLVLARKNPRRPSHWPKRAANPSIGQVAW